MNAENVIWFDAMFVVLIASFGVGTSNISFNSLAAIAQPPLSQFPSVNCNGLCSPFAGIVQATAYIGWAIVNLPVLFAYAIIVIITFLNIVLLITFSPGFSASGVPVVGFFFVALQLVVLFEVFRLFSAAVPK